MNAYRIAFEPENHVYAAILASSLRLSSAGLLVVQDTIELAKSGAEILSKLRPFMIRESRDSRWPGTVLHGTTATVFRFSICRDSVEILEQGANRLYDWQQPERPEDLSFLRADGTPWLFSIAHESEAFIIVSDDELEWLRGHVPDLGPLVREDVGDVT